MTAAVDLTSHIVLPGLVDGHMHTTSSIPAEGAAQDVGNRMMHGGSFPRKRYETDQSGRRPGRLIAKGCRHNGT